MNRRSIATFAALSIVAVGLGLASSTPAGASGTITPWSSSVAVGATTSITAGGCPYTETEGDTSYSYQRAELVLITGTGADERLAGFANSVNDTRQRIRVPGWVDPADPAVITGRCIRTTYDFDTGDGTTTTLFTYADAPIDITPGTASPSGPLLTLDRTSAAGGQVIGFHGTGCEGADYLEAVLFEGTDLSGRTMGDFVAYGRGRVGADGSFSGEIELNSTGESEADNGHPLAAGGYSAVAACAAEEAWSAAFSAPQVVTVAGSFPSDTITGSAVDGVVTVSGEGCTGGQQVTVTFDGYAYNGGGFEGLRTKRTRALVHRSVLELAKLAPNEDGEILDTVEATPAPDGTWTVTTDIDADSYDVMVLADCGDPASDGFRYVRTYLFESNEADLYIDRTSPTSSPAGASVSAEVGGSCDDDVRVAFTDQDRNVLSASDPVSLNSYGLALAAVTAPSEPGTYGIVGLCGDKVSYPQAYEVFAPTTISASSPLPSDPTEGWPSRGPRETYHGRIGPIALPSMDDGGMAESGAKDLDPSGLFIEVPRPPGDFAITKMSFDLVDAEGMPVPQTSAHLHHFVIMNTSAENPACPDGTFGLNGEMVGAAGSERTVLNLGDPYGKVVKAKDGWSGVYEVMSRSMEDQQVFITYDLDLRRDIENVRPVRSYFGSATGCDSFTWTIDGSGTPDHQSHYITIDKPGRLIGTGAHIHNGGLYADLTNDRGRQLCRSTITYGDEPVGHGMEMAGARHRARAMADDPASTTTIVVDPMEPEWPPEFYDDDLTIAKISNCPLAESVSAGERLRFDAVYANDRARSGVMGIFTAYVWEGGGPAKPGPDGAQPIAGDPTYTG